MSEPLVPGQGRRADLDALDREMTELADQRDFILGDGFEEANGQMLGRLLADAGWPRRKSPGTYSLAGDCSNTALRTLQRKYHAALIATAKSREERT